MIFTSYFRIRGTDWDRDKRREWVKELQAEPSRKSFDDYPTGHRRGRHERGGQSPPESRHSLSAYRHQGKVALEMPYVPGEGLITIQTLGAGEALGWSWLFPPYQWHFSARAVEPTEAVVFKADALRNKAKENPAFGYDLALRVGGIMLQRLQATRMRLLDICEVSQ
jgi:CRP-like cAMP-binding protein